MPPVEFAGASTLLITFREHADSTHMTLLTYFPFEEFKRKFITCSTNKLACSHCVRIRQDTRFPIFQKPTY